MIDEKSMEESSFFQLKNGQYLMDEEQSQVFSTIMSEHPHNNPSYKWDEMAMAELFAKCYAHNTVYCPEAKQWYSYDGSVWVKDTGGILASEHLKEFTRLMQLYCGEIPEEYEKEYRKFVSKLGDRRVRDRILKDAQGEARVSITRFDSDPYIINCQNGTYNLKSGEFHFHRAEDYLTMKTACDFPVESMDTDFPRWDRFIDEITCGDKDVAAYLQRALGYSLVGMANEECMFIAYGKTTRNGKGTLLNTIHTILGDYAKTIGVDFICQSRGGRSYSQANPMVCALKGARFLTMSESDDAGKLDEAIIKNYTGGDPISTRQLYGEAFDFTPQFKMWLSCNTLPTVNDKSLFSSDRVKVIEFKRHFGEDERDVKLKEKFLEEKARTAIFLWLLEGYQEYKKVGLMEPKSVRDAVKGYEKRNDRVALFFEDRCVREEGAKVSRSDLYTAYKSWCRSNGINAKSAQKFYEEMDSYGEQKIVHGMRLYVGIKLSNLSNVTIK